MDCRGTHLTFGVTELVCITIFSNFRKKSTLVNTLFSDEDILRFEIAMKDFSAMTEFETSKELEEEEFRVVRIDPAKRR